MTLAMDIPIVLPWWRKRLALHLVAILAGCLSTAVALSVWLGNSQRIVRMALVNVAISTVTRDVFHDFVPLRSRAVPRDVVYLDASEGGRVERVLVESGDLVVAGQPLLELSNTELELDVLDREARLVESITQLQAYQTQLEQNRLDNDKTLESINYDIARLARAVERRETLTVRGMLARETGEGVRDELEYMRKLRPLQIRGNNEQNRLRIQQLPQIRAQLSKLQQDIEITRRKLDQLSVRAPLDGRVTAMNLKVGERRNRGERLGEITPDTGYKVSAEIDEYYLGRLKVDQAATIDFDGHTVPLRVRRVYPQVKDGTFMIDLSFVNEMPQGLLPGQALQGRLSLGDDSLALVLASGAFLERTGGDWVFVVDADGRAARRRPIRTGRRNIEQVEILGGLAAGERVITSDYSSFDHIDRIDLQ
jgi:HlyD family secretion protein